MLSRQARTLVSRSATQRSSLPLPNSRAYAQVASTQDPKPPVAVYGIDGTYASALVCPNFKLPLYPEVLLACLSQQCETPTDNSSPPVHSSRQNLIPRTHRPRSDHARRCLQKRPKVTQHSQRSYPNTERQVSDCAGAAEAYG